MTAIWLLLRPFWPYIAAFTLGGFMVGGAAWKVQGLRLTEARQDFTEYKQKQTQLAQEAKDAADKQRDQAREEYARAVKVLAADIEAGDVLRRCLAAGKCGRVRDVPVCTGIRLPPTGGADEASPRTVPVAGEPAAEVGAEVLGDCANGRRRCWK